MIRFRQFRVQVMVRVLALFASLTLLAFAVLTQQRLVLLLLLLAAIAAQTLGLLRYINRTNRELESFLAGLRFGDFQQTSRIGQLGPSFQALEQTLMHTMEKFKRLRTDKEQQAQYFRAVVQHIPMPLFVVHPDERVELLNHATRRTFNVAEFRNVDGLAAYGAAFQRDVRQVKPGEALLTTIELAGAQEYYILTATRLTLDGQPHRLISLQNVQGELDATELATWQNLLRVTSHEILNSLAPVSSCAQTARALLDDAIRHAADDPVLLEDLHGVGESIDTVLRRSEGLVRFIQSYRQLSRMPQPDKQRLQVGRMFQRLESLLHGELARKNIQLTLHHEPAGLAVMADPDLLDQAMINLVRNAADALAAKPAARITLSAGLDDKQRTVIEVRDNGPGIPPDTARNIFVPFFTTREQGSGVGLSLVRYIMLSHGGQVSYRPAAGGGSSFRLVF